MRTGRPLRRLGRRAAVHLGRGGGRGRGRPRAVDPRSDELVRRIPRPPAELKIPASPNTVNEPRAVTVRERLSQVLAPTQRRARFVCAWNLARIDRPVSAPEPAQPRVRLTPAPAWRTHSCVPCRHSWRHVFPPARFSSPREFACVPGSTVYILAVWRLNLSILERASDPHLPELLRRVSRLQHLAT